MTTACVFPGFRLQYSLRVAKSTVTANVQALIDEHPELASPNSVDVQTLDTGCELDRR
jgi:hypothetical protein